MSESLVKQSLALFDNDFDKTDRRKKSLVDKSIQMTKKENKWKEIQQKSSTRKRKKTYKSAIEKHKAESTVDKTQDNVALLLRVTAATKARENIVTKVFGSQSIRESHLAEHEQSCLFTDEELKDIQKEAKRKKMS